MKAIPQASTYHESLVLLGLTPDQASVYEFLLKNGPHNASKTASGVQIERTLVYKILEKLAEMVIVLKKDEPGKVAVFEAGHPSRLAELAERRESQAKTAKQAMQVALEPMTIDYNLAVGKPGIRFFEGLAGVKQVIDDTLTANGEVLQYLDMDELETKFPKESEFYTKRRINLKIKKRLLVRDTPYARQHMEPNQGLTESKLLKTNGTFQALTYIYDKKIASVTLDPNRLIGVIMEDEILANMNRTLFNCLWEQGILPEIPKAPIQTSPAVVQ